MQLWRAAGRFWRLPKGRNGRRQCLLLVGRRVEEGGLIPAWYSNAPRRHGFAQRTKCIAAHGNATCFKHEAGQVLRALRLTLQVFLAKRWACRSLLVCWTCSISGGRRAMVGRGAARPSATPVQPPNPSCDCAARPASSPSSCWARFLLVYFAAWWVKVGWKSW